jgi:hypothetical protein
MALSRGFGNPQPGFSDRAWFRDALASRGLVVSEPYTGSVDRRRIVVFARAIRSTSGEPVAVAAASIDLMVLTSNLRDAALPPQTVITVFSPSVKVVARTVDADGYVARDLSHR